MEVDGFVRLGIKVLTVRVSWTVGTSQSRAGLRWSGADGSAPYAELWLKRASATLHSRHGGPHNEKSESVVNFLPFCPSQPRLLTYTFSQSLRLGGETFTMASRANTGEHLSSNSLTDDQINDILREAEQRLAAKPAAAAVRDSTSSRPRDTTEREPGELKEKPLSIRSTYKPRPENKVSQLLYVF